MNKVRQADLGTPAPATSETFLSSDTSSIPSGADVAVTLNRSPPLGEKIRAWPRSVPVNPRPSSLRVLTMGAPPSTSGACATLE